MMLPILISVSVTPVSYFFCATADTEAAAMINPESPSDLMKSLAQRFMNFLHGCGQGVTVFVGQFPRFFCDGMDDSRGAGLPEAAGGQETICRVTGCGAAQQIACTKYMVFNVANYMRPHIPRRADLASSSAASNSAGASGVARAPPLLKITSDKSCPSTLQR